MPFLMSGHFVHSITFFCYYEILMSLSCNNFWGGLKYWWDYGPSQYGTAKTANFEEHKGYVHKGVAEPPPPYLKQEY